MTTAPNPAFVNVEDDDRISGSVTCEGEPMDRCMAYAIQYNESGHKEVVDVTLTDSDGEYVLTAEPNSEALVGVSRQWRYSHLRPPYGYYDTWIIAPERTQ